MNDFQQMQLGRVEVAKVTQRHTKVVMGVDIGGLNRDEGSQEWHRAMEFSSMKEFESPLEQANRGVDRFPGDNNPIRLKGHSDLAIEFRKLTFVVGSHCASKLVAAHGSCNGREQFEIEVVE